MTGKPGRRDSLWLHVNYSGRGLDARIGRSCERVSQIGVHDMATILDSRAAVD